MTIEEARLALEDRLNDFEVIMEEAQNNVVEALNEFNAAVLESVGIELEVVIEEEDE